MDEWLAEDPLFSVWTLDRGHWIDPFTGTVVKAAFGDRSPGREHLLQNRPWMKFALRTAPEIEAFRWAHLLKGRIAKDGRLRIFRKDGQWLNPFDGRWTRGIPLPGGKVDAATVRSMAQVLAHAHLPRLEMLDEAELARLVTEAALAVSPSGCFAPIASALAEPRPAASAPASVSTEPVIDMTHAKAVIEKLLPRIPEIPGFPIAVHYEPHSLVGGDFYELVPVGTSALFLAVGDVSGHDTSAAMIVASTIKSLRHAVREGGTCAEIVGRFNDDVHDDLHTSYFITMFAAVIDLETKVMTSVCAGHHPGVLANPRRRSILMQVGTPGPAIGLMKGEMFRANIEPHTLQLQGGDTFLQFTDGLFEAADPAGSEYGRRRFMGDLLMAMDEAPAAVITRMIDGVRAHALDGFADDITALVVKIEGP